jgi:hypothetical protein
MPFRVPPWDPYLRNVLCGLLIHALAAGIGDWRVQAPLQRQALELIAEVATELVNRI